jgi:hypothetical protein
MKNELNVDAKEVTKRSYWMKPKYKETTKDELDRMSK